MEYVLRDVSTKAFGMLLECLPIIIDKVYITLVPTFFTLLDEIISSEGSLFLGYPICLSLSNIL